MSTRDELYRKFGPLILEALALVVKDEINTLRTNHGLANRTNQQIIDAIETKLFVLGKYDWMNE